MTDQHRVTHNVDARVRQQCEWCQATIGPDDWMAYVDGIPACEPCSEKARAGQWLGEAP